MISLNTIVLVTAAGFAGVLFIQYCIFCDNKRKEREWREKRRSQLKLKLQRQQGKFIQTNEVLKEMPTKEAIERYFLQEMQVAEGLSDTGDYKLSVEHFTNALHVCSNPDILLKVLEQSMSPQVFDMLHDKIDEVAYRQTLYANNYFYGPRRTLDQYRQLWAADQANKLKATRKEQAALETFT